MTIEKIVISKTDKRPQGVVHSAFFQTYIQSRNVLTTGRRIFGNVDAPTEFYSADQWNLLFCYGAGYTGGGIYDWFAGVLLSSPHGGPNFIITDKFDLSKEGIAIFGSPLEVRSIDMQEVEFDRELDLEVKFDRNECEQVSNVVHAWHSLFELSQDEELNEYISIIAPDKKLPNCFKRNSKNCYVSGIASKWNINIGHFSRHWKFTAKFS